MKASTKPSEILKSVNPSEAQLLENGSNLHVRYRLGGERFPPTIYYKIYINRSLVDMNSFAPRDYAAVNKTGSPQPKKMFYSEYKEKRVAHDGWYIRQENNGWRPLSLKPEEKKDSVEVATGYKVKYFHHSKDLRKKKDEKQKRMNKLRWFQTMFEKAKEEEPALEGQSNPFKDSKLVDLDEDGFSKEVDDLIEWSDNLDFEKYTSYWKQLSTTSYTGYPAQYSYGNQKFNASMAEEGF